MSQKTQLMKALVGELGRPPYHNAEGLILSVSGGVDSMVMLDLFVGLRHVHKAALSVVHVHHNTGQFANRSAELVRDYCVSHDLPLTVESFQWDGNGNFEYEAAGFRRRVLQRLCDAGHYVLLAHHREDQAETFLQAVVRGVGPSSSFALRKQRGIFLRPLLQRSRAEILEHAGRRNTPHVLDPTNYHHENSLRNAIRHEVAPVLRRFHHGFEERLGEWLEGLAQQQDALAAEARELFDGYFLEEKLDRRVFSMCRPYLHPFLLKLFWERLDCPKPDRPQERTLRKMIQFHETGRFDIDGRVFYCDHDALALVVKPPQDPVTGQFGQALDWGPFRFRLERTGAEAGLENPSNRLELHPSEAVSPQIKDRLRTMRTPHRIRENLPSFVFDGKPHHLLDVYRLVDSGALELHQERGEILRCAYDHRSPSGN